MKNVCGKKLAPEECFCSGFLCLSVNSKKLNAKFIPRIRFRFLSSCLYAEQVLLQTFSLSFTFNELWLEDLDNVSKIFFAFHACSELLPCSGCTCKSASDSASLELLLSLSSEAETMWMDLRRGRGDVSLLIGAGLGEGLHSSLLIGCWAETEVEEEVAWVPGTASLEVFILGRAGRLFVLLQQKTNSFGRS